MDSQQLSWITSAGTLLGPVAFTLNQWNHVAIVRNGITLKMYLNGAEVASNSNAGHVYDPTNWRIGSGHEVLTTNRRWTGKIGPFKVTAGHPRYTATFTPSTNWSYTYTANDTNWANVMLHMPLNGVHTGATHYDNKMNDALSLTYYGTPITSTTQSKFGAGALYCDGTNNNYIKVSQWNSDTTTNVNRWTMTNTFTIDCWVYPTVGSVTAKLLSTRTGDGWELLWYNNKFGFEGFGSCNTSGQKLTTDTFALNNWYHLAWVSDVSQQRFYVDGVLKFTTAYSYTWSVQGDLAIGQSNGSYTEPFTGYMNDLRVTIGVARYPTGTVGNNIFTPPTIPYKSY
jgi:hypothetical protein